MRITRFAAMAMLCICFAGCSLVESAKRTLLLEPLAFPTCKDSHRTQRRDRQWAKAAWEAEMAANPELCSSVEYQRGFEDGFADYLYAGGTGEPPPVPPRRLWNLDYRTPEGHKAVEDWFAGFRQGARAVREAGYRDFVTVKSSLLACNNLDAPVRPSGILEEPKPAEVISTPQAAESVPKPQEPALPDHERSPSTENLLPDRGGLAPQLSMPWPGNRGAAESGLVLLLPPVDDAKLAIQRSHLAESVPKPQEPALPDHKLSPNTEKLPPDRGGLAPQLSMPWPGNRGAAESGLVLLLPPVDDAKLAIQRSHPAESVPKPQKPALPNQEPSSDTKKLLPDRDGVEPPRNVSGPGDREAAESDLGPLLRQLTMPSR
jgi:hypothetical protein